MKSIKILLLLLIASTAGAKAQFTKAELQVSGLNCALCSKATIKSLKELTFVDGVEPDLMHNIYVITFKKEAPVNFEQIGKLVHDEGLFVSSLKATLNFKEVQLADNRFTYHGDVYQVINQANKSLEGEIPVMLVDKGLAPKSVSKKYLANAPEIAAPANGKVYHVAI